MPQLNTSSTSILDLLSSSSSNFLIPDFQRPYAWKKDMCETLWEDILNFAIPNGNAKDFDQTSEYFLGTIVTYKRNGVYEIIDGQQRLTTIMLLLRAYYKSFGQMKDAESLKTKVRIEQCIWKTDEFDQPDMSSLKLNSDVATDDDKGEFMEILRTGVADDKFQSRYARNYRTLQAKIDKFKDDFPTYFVYLPIRLLKNCIILNIEADSQDTALTIFSTLNNRGLSLSDADIFKSQLYNFYGSIGKKDYFIEEWKKLESKCNAIFHPIKGTPVDELFSRYMYYARAVRGESSTTLQSMRQFYSNDSYSLLTKEETFGELIDLYNFWNDVDNQNESRFSNDVLKRLFILNYAPNSMWVNIVTAYFLTNRDNENDDYLDDESFCSFLDRLIAFVWTYAIINPGVTAVRAPIIKEISKLINGEEVTFADFKVDKTQFNDVLFKVWFNNSKTITKSMLAWWAYQNESQKLIKPLNTILEIEHIYPRAKFQKGGYISDKSILEKIGNKSLLEKRINIRAAEYRLCDKAKYYSGYFDNKRNKFKEGTNIRELIAISDMYDDFTEMDIMERTLLILQSFEKFVESNNLFM